MSNTATNPTAAPVHTFVHGPLPRGVPDVIDRIAHSPGVRQVAIMPDVHLASEFCVGMVVASDNTLFPNAVGGDIGCGMLALKFQGSAQDALADPQNAARLLGALSTACPGRRHHHRTGHNLPVEIVNLPPGDPHLRAILTGEESRLQLGTLGAGNHFLELQRDDSPTENAGDLWLMIHTGSRHLGQCVLHHYLPKSQKLATNIMALPADSPAGRAYLADVAIARAWAKENRRLLALRAADAIERILHLPPLLDTLVDCDHNHVTTKTHNGQPLWIHRKGATAAAPNQPGIIPGSMGTRSFHTLGQGLPESLNSSSHGAGRSLSRTEARDKVTISALRQQLRGVWYDARLERQLREEAPMAYKNIDHVMQAQSTLTQITRRLRPVLVYKGA